MGRQASPAASATGPSASSGVTIVTLKRASSPNRSASPVESQFRAVMPPGKTISMFLARDAFSKVVNAVLNGNSVRDALVEFEFDARHDLGDAGRGVAIAIYRFGSDAPVQR